MKFAIKNFFSKCDQICRKLRIWSHLLKNYLMGNFIFCAVIPTKDVRQDEKNYKYDSLPLHRSDFSRAFTAKMISAMSF